MTTKLVKAAGGCAAPPVMITAPPNLGQIQVRTQEKLALNEPNWAQLIVVHPNHTGFQRHPLNMLPISAHYVTDVTVTYEQQARSDREDHHRDERGSRLPFLLHPTGSGTLRVEVKDSRGQSWSKSMDVAAK